MDKKRFAFIESNTTGTGFLFLQKALELGFKVAFLTQDPSKYSFLSDKRLSIVKINTMDKNSVLESLKEFSDLAGVFSTSEYFIEMAALVAESLNLPGNDPRTIADCRNKRIFYEKLNPRSVISKLKKIPFEIPKTWFVKTLKDISERQQDFVYPLIVKPVSGTGSIGVRKCSNFSELCQHAFRLFHVKNNERGIRNEEGVIIQNFVQGPEFSAEIVANGDNYFRLGITAKHTTEGNYFIETGHDFPAHLPFELQTQIWNAIEEMLKFLNFRFGPAHIEFKLQGERVIIIELNPRLAGGMIPQLICHACGIDLYSKILKLYTSEKTDFHNLQYQGSSIRFFVAKKSGTIVDFAKEDVLKQLEDVVEVHYTKAIGDLVEIHNDYRDRIGYLITKGFDSSISKASADESMKHFYIDIQPIKQDKGRLSQAPHLLIQQIVRNPKNRTKWIEELEKISKIDLAYVLMLYKKGIIDGMQALPLVLEIQDFQKNLSVLSENLDFSRGTYYAYENHLKDRLGIELSGNNHIGRSRNDINATLFYLVSRDSFLRVYKKCLEFSELLLEKARQEGKIPLPVYSQHQPAAPGNYAFYLLAINEQIKRITQDLIGIESQLNTSPLGAGAGCGTDIAIDPHYVAKLLGFNDVSLNALDAISSRDFILRYKSILANLSVTLSRVAQDYQLWTTQEFHFFELPDSLCGSSSMMPQKKNPYILEIVKIKTMDVISNLSGTLAKMHKVPTGNSIEVSSAAYDMLSHTIDECLDALDLLILVIRNAEPHWENMLIASQKGLTIATYVANHMMKRESISFREAHLRMGLIIRNALENQEDAFIELTKLLNVQNADALELINHIVQQLNYGGGPSAFSVEDQIKKSQHYFQNHTNWIKKKEEDWAKAKVYLEEETNQLIKQLEYA